MGLILAPNGTSLGGITGISVILSSFLPVGVGSFTILLNLPLMIISWIKFGGKFVFGTIFAIFISGITADICQLAAPLTQTPILASVAGGTGLAVGCGIIFLSGATTGGTDILAKLIKRSKPHIKTSQIFLILDGGVCILNGIVFQSFDRVLYSFISLFLFSKTLDFMLYGGDAAKLALIISKENQKILPLLINNAKVGCTMLKGSTGYKNINMDIILCAIKKRHLPEVRDIVLKADEKAFMLIGNANEIYGEGFKTSNSDFF